MGDEDEVQAYFAHLNLQVDRAWDIFRLIDFDKSGTVSLEEFVTGCLRLRGQARTVDVAQVTYDVARLQQKLVTFMKFVEEEFDKLHRKQAFTSDGCGSARLMKSPTTKS